MIRIIAVGKIKERFFQDAISEYSKRLSAYTKLEIIEVADEKCPEKLSEKQEEAVREKEGARILKNIRENDHVITLEINGKRYSSVGFSEMLGGLEVSGKSTIVFVIGGSIGLSKQVSERADSKISFSDMTFPHQLMRVILMEQVYRSYKIMHGEPYHK